MKKKIYNWLLKKLAPKYTKHQIKMINQFKSCFYIFFEGGYNYDPIYENGISITTFGVTDLNFDFGLDFYGKRMVDN